MKPTETGLSRDRFIDPPRQLDLVMATRQRQEILEPSLRRLHPLLLFEPCDDSEGEAKFTVEQTLLLGSRGDTVKLAVRGNLSAAPSKSPPRPRTRISHLFFFLSFCLMSTSGMIPPFGVFDV